jgi:hypothetical protein
MDQSTGSGHSGGGSRTRSRHKDTTWTEIAKEEPIACMAIAAAVGFMLGGGARRSGGLAILTMLGQIVVREAFGDFASLGDFIGKAQEKTT